MTDYTAVDLPFLLAEEDRLRLARFDADDAWALGNLAVSLARADGLAVTIAVAHGQQLMFHAALAGTVADQADWIRRKTALVYRFGHSSYFVGRSYRDRGAAFEEEPHLDPASYAAHGGAIPLSVAGVGLVGVLAVSGLPQDQDHALAVRALEAHLLGSGA
ncbi:MAG: hypothetical protein QOE76_2335 [Frankiales bacterium]|jgi:uncharacterized protein (UPF0303 family)|nr:hypothetical protein [Frankiales bacterium]MDX6244612.1 hypothetical protein [Frankiales bacterium]